MLSILVAHDLNRLIGYNNTIPWHYPQASEEIQNAIKKDMAFFRKQSIHRPIIMGRTTYQSLPGKLKKRFNIVVSKKLNEEITEPDYNLRWRTSIDDAINLAKTVDSEVCIIGGAQIYQQTMSLVDVMYVSVFQFKFEPGFGNKVYFPEYNENDWDCSILEEYPGLQIKKLTRKAK